MAGPLEELVTAAVLYRLDTPQLADLLAGRAAADKETAALAETISTDRVLLDDLAAMYARRDITTREWMTARNPIQARIEDGERRLARATRSDAIAGLVGNGTELHRKWPDLDLTRQAAIVTAVLDHIVIGPGTPGARQLDPDRVDPIWRL